MVDLFHFIFIFLDINVNLLVVSSYLENRKSPLGEHKSEQEEKIFRHCWSCHFTVMPDFICSGCPLLATLFG